MAYLDHAGAALPSPTQTDALHADMKEYRLANPHSRHPSSKYTSDLIERSRNRVLQHFNTSSQDYLVVFTANATHSLKIVAESFDFGDRLSSECQMFKSLDDAPRGLFAYMYDSHTSVVGMREMVRNRCNGVCVCRIDDLLKLNARQLDETELTAHCSDLFAITAMSNFCGCKYPLSIIEQIHSWRNGSSFVCLDAACWVSTSFLDLSIYKPDFLAISFYKMFGFPTGLGALIVKKDACKLLQKRYFGGGTVQLSIPDDFSVYRRSDFVERFEDGTTNYWAIAALERGFDDLEAFGGIRAIQDKTYTLAKRAVSILQKARHANGEAVACIYGAGERIHDTNLQGPIVAFNLLRDDGSYIGYAGVDRMCELFGIELRTGCFCNQGACQEYLHISHEDLLTNFQKGKVCGDAMDVIDGRPVGAVRISFGRQSTDKDVDLFEEMLSTCFISSLQPEAPPPRKTTAPLTLTDIFVYPVKSCGALPAQEWSISSTGLEYDRNWMVVSKEGAGLSQKRVPQLCRLHAEIESDRLRLSYKGASAGEVSVPVVISADASGEQHRVCSDQVETVDCGDEVAAWLCTNLDGEGYRLCQIRNDVDALRSCSLTGEGERSISLSNQAPYLVVNRQSVAEIAAVVGLETEDAIHRFRPNLVIDGLAPFEEDRLTALTIGDVHFTVVGKCTRCQIICVDQETGEKDPKLLVALKDHRVGKQATFGVYLQHAVGSEGATLRVGMPITVTSEVAS